MTEDESRPIVRYQDIRIGVAIDDRGAWYAVGSFDPEHFETMSDDDKIDKALDCLNDDRAGGGTDRPYIIKVRLPIPESLVCEIDGSVEYHGLTIDEQIDQVTRAAHAEQAEQGGES